MRERGTKKSPGESFPVLEQGAPFGIRLEISRSERRSVDGIHELDLEAQLRECGLHESASILRSLQADHPNRWCITHGASPRRVRARVRSLPSLAWGRGGANGHVPPVMPQ